jgi:hypothetical protein
MDLVAGERQNCGSAVGITLPKPSSLPRSRASGAPSEGPAPCLQRREASCGRRPREPCGKPTCRRLRVEASRPAGGADPGARRRLRSPDRVENDQSAWRILGSGTRDRREYSSEPHAGDLIARERRKSDTSFARRIRIEGPGMGERASRARSACGPPPQPSTVRFRR